jgi:serine phosphatase RsbU (regulator of sigma subunit)
MAPADPPTYPWHSESVFAAELDRTGTILRANPALAYATGIDGDPARFEDVITSEQRAAFADWLVALGEQWEQATYGFFDGRSGAAEDRCVWLHRRPGGSIELVAEPAWREYDRLVEQMLQLNEDLIGTQRSLGRRQRELERAQDEAARSARRIRQLEAILLAGLTPRDFDEALGSLLRTAQDLLPGERADILLLDESGDTLVVRASTGPNAAAPPEHRRVDVGTTGIGEVVVRGYSRIIEDLALARWRGEALDRGSLIATPLRADGEVIGALAVSAAAPRAFADDDLRLLELVGERIALAIGQAQVRDREHRLAETLQRSMLPQRLPALDGLELAARYLPRATSVGGDFYDAMPLAEGTVGVAIGDVTGKGLRAAAAMGQLRSALHAYALDEASPATVLRRLDRLAVADGAIATAMFLVLDPGSGRLELASAGHPPPVLLDSAGARLVDVRAALSPPLGVPAPREAQLGLVLEPGGTMLLYTDGLVERTHDIEAGLEALVQAADALATYDLDALCDGLLAEMAPDGRYRDDVALVAVRRPAAV